MVCAEMILRDSQPSMLRQLLPIIRQEQDYQSDILILCNILNATHITIMSQSSYKSAIKASPWVKRHAPLIPLGGQVLDVACGKGRHTRHLHALGHKVVATDIDLAGIRDLEGNAGIELHETDLELGGWPFEAQQFTGIVVTNYLYRPHFPCIARSLAPNGLLIFETFAAGNERFGRPCNPDYLLQPNELLHAFMDSLDIIAFEQAEDDQPHPAVRQRICARRR
jgi:SAM-dependent methyltransferase